MSVTFTVVEIGKKLPQTHQEPLLFHIAFEMSYLYGLKPFVCCCFGLSDNTGLEAQF